MCALFTTPSPEPSVVEAQEGFVGWMKDPRKKKNIPLQSAEGLGWISKGVGEKVGGISPLRDKSSRIKHLRTSELEGTSEAI